MWRATSFLLVIALVFIFLALLAYFKVFMVSSNWLLEGLTFTIMTVLQLPPNESFSSRVNFESYVNVPVLDRARKTLFCSCRQEH